MTAWQAAWDKGDVDALDGLFADGYTRTSKATGGTIDVDGLKAEIAAVREAFPDLRTTIDDVVEGGDAVAVFWTSTGTHTHNYLDVPPTGLTVKTRGSNILSVKDGRILHESVTWDGSELLAGLGIRPLQGIAVPPGCGIRLGGPECRTGPGGHEGLQPPVRHGVTVVTTKEHGKPKGLGRQRILLRFP